MQIRRNRGQNVGLVDIGLVAQADQPRQPETLAAGPVDHGGADGARVRDKSHISRGWARRGQKGGVQRHMGVQDADAVRPKQPDPKLLRHSQAFRLQPGACLPGFPEPPRGDDCGPDAAHPTFPQRLGDSRGRDEQNGQISRVWNVCDSRVNGLFQQRAATGVDIVDGAPVPALHQVACQGKTQLARILGSADHDHTGRIEKTFETLFVLISGHWRSGGSPGQRQVSGSVKPDGEAEEARTRRAGRDGFPVQ